MRGLWQRFVSSLAPGVRWALSVWTALYLINFTAVYFNLASIGGWLMLTGPAVFHGQIWRLASYALLPANLPDLLINSISVVVFGGMLERVWVRRDFLLYGLIAAVGAGLTKIALQSASPVPLLGPGPVAFALMLAAGRLFADQTIIVPPSFSMTIRQVVLILALVGFLGLAYRTGWTNAVIQASGGGFGIAYLWLRSRIAQPRAARPVVSKRINRLEL
jgi:membrane associated rhomboid family serine protease